MIKFRSLKGKTVDWPYDPAAFRRFNEEVWPKIDRAPGYLSAIEAFFLYETARTLKGASRGIDVPPATHVVEIGSFKGRSTVAIGHGLKSNETGTFRLVCVDPFLSEDRDPELTAAFHANIKEGGVSDIVDVMPAFSVEAAKSWPADRGIAMLWIDGNHEYENVRDDFLLWSRHLVPGGVVAFHDWYLIGVQEAIVRHLLPVSYYQNLTVVDHNLIGATRIERPPTARQIARKKRVYITLRTGHISALIALLFTIREAVRRPFGGITAFLTGNPDIT